MKKVIFLVFLITSLIWLANTTFSQSESQRFSTRVQVEIKRGESLQNEIYSYITRELRSLGDVDVVDTLPDWVFHIMAFEPTLKFGEKVGLVVISVVILRREDVSWMFESIGYREIETVFPSLSTLYLYTDLVHRLQAGKRQDLRELCEGIIADFDSIHLKKARKEWQEAQEFLRKTKKQ